MIKLGIMLIYGLTDAANLIEKDISTVVLGMGNKLLYSKDENIVIANMKKAVFIIILKEFS